MGRRTANIDVQVAPEESVNAESIERWRSATDILFAVEQRQSDSSDTRMLNVIDELQVA